MLEIIQNICQTGGKIQKLAMDMDQKRQSKTHVAEMRAVSSEGEKNLSSLIQFKRLLHSLLCRMI